MPLRWAWMTARLVVAVYILACFTIGLALRAFVRPPPHVLGLHPASLVLTGVVLVLVTVGDVPQPPGG